MSPPTSKSECKECFEHFINKKQLEEQALENTSALLLPHDTRAIWYADKVLPNAEVLMFRGNFELDNGKHTRYGMILAIFHPIALERNRIDE